MDSTNLLTDDRLSFIRAAAIVMLKIDGKVSQTEPSYVKCLKDIANAFDLQHGHLELIVDATTGNPLEVFKLENKQIVDYSLRSDISAEQEFHGVFDPARMALLTQILKGSKKALTDVFLQWFHQFKYFDQAKTTVN